MRVQGIDYDRVIVKDVKSEVVSLIATVKIKSIEKRKKAHIIKKDYVNQMTISGQKVKVGDVINVYLEDALNLYDNCSIQFSKDLNANENEMYSMLKSDWKRINYEVLDTKSENRTVIKHERDLI